MARVINRLLLVLLLLSGATQAGHREAASFTLLARSSARPVQPVLTPEQRQWREGRQELVLGTSAPDYPPFDITGGGNDYQGLTAEYANLIGKALQLPVRVLRFSSRQAAVEALRHGDIDLLGSANGYEAASDGLALSRPYAVDQPVLVTREDENRALDTDLAGMRLGMLYHYLPRQEVLTAYPKAELLAFGSSSQALNAVAFGQADVFIGDTISTHYQLNRGHLPRLRMANFGKHEAIGFGFALRQQDTVLLDLVNTILDRQSPAIRSSIFKRWSAGSDLLLSDRQLQLSAAEQQWLQEHPVMRVAADDAAAPLSYFDDSGHFRGITADLLDLIRLRTGLRFEVQRASGIADMVARLKDGRADVIAALASAGKAGDDLQISRPYLESQPPLSRKRLCAGQPQGQQCIEFTGAVAGASYRHYPLQHHERHAVPGLPKDKLGRDRKRVLLHGVAQQRGCRCGDHHPDRRQSRLGQQPRTGHPHLGRQRTRQFRHGHHCPVTGAVVDPRQGFAEHLTGGAGGNQQPLAWLWQA